MDNMPASVAQIYTLGALLAIAFALIGIWTSREIKNKDRK